MTTHRLIRCDLERLASATDRPGRSSEVRPRGRTLRWPTQVLGSTVWCTLELEQGANGVLAHLSAVRPHGARTGWARRIERVVLAAWTARALTLVAASAEMTVPPSGGGLPRR